MWEVLAGKIEGALKQFESSEPRPSLHPVPGTTPLTIQAAILPPVIYYLALVLLPPPPPPAVTSAPVRLLRTILAITAAILFIRLPLAYHVPQSIGLTYQLGLVGIYGGTRVLDAFFISAWWFGNIPKRVSYIHHERPETPYSEDGELRREREWTDGGVRDPYHHTEKSNNKVSKSRLHSPERDDAAAKCNEDKRSKVNGRANGSIHASAPRATSTSIHIAPAKDVSHYSRRQSTTTETASYFLYKTVTGPRPTPVTEYAITHKEWPRTWFDRAAWALELELSMRGQGFTWTTADVRHTRKTWIPTIANRIHSIVVHVMPIQLAAWYIISTIYDGYLASTLEIDDYDPFSSTSRSSMRYRLHRQHELFDNLSTPVQLLLTIALGSFLMSAFSLGHSIAAIMLHPLKPHPLSFFPPLYTTRVWSLTSVRGFWSFGWHRLFARLFLVWGVWPGEWLERKLLGKSKDQPADVGKVIGAFTSSAIVHAFSVRGVMAGRWSDAAGEMRFFLLNGIAVVLEGAVQRLVTALRRKKGWRQSVWYDAWIGRVWWILAVCWTGREFARGWVKSGLVREMAFR